MLLGGKRKRIRGVTDHLNNIFTILIHKSNSKHQGMGNLSIDYYLNIFRNNPEKLASMKELLLKDFKTMESKQLTCL
jgi:hypothetical protein